MVEKLLAVGLHNRSRTLPGMTRFGGAHVGPTVVGTANPKSRPHVLKFLRETLSFATFYKSTGYRVLKIILLSIF